MSDVRNFGAVGNGQADDTAAVQRAINEGDGVVTFPRGEFRITKTLRAELSVHGRFALDGSGAAAKLVMDGPGPALSITGTHEGTANPGEFKPEHWLRERMPVIRNIEIEGAHPGAEGIYMEGVMQPTLSGLLIREVGTGIRLFRRARNVLIDRCHIYHCREAGIYLDSLNLHQINITGSHISFCRFGGIRVEGSEIRNLQITGNDIEYNNERTHDISPDGRQTADIYIDARKGRVREGTITGNTIQATSTGGDNICFIGRGPDENQDTGLFSIAGNLIGTQENNIRIVSACGITVSGNCIYGCRNRNILVESSRNIAIGPNIFDHPAYKRTGELGSGIRLVDSFNCSITGVIIQDCRDSKNIIQSVPREALIEAVDCRGVNISGAQVFDGFPYGILLEDCRNTLVSGCAVLEERKPGKMLASISLKGSGGGNLLASNRFGAGSEGCIAGDGCAGKTGNLCD